MLVEVKVRVCDTCKRVGVPTKQYSISADDGRAGETDRCADHAEAFEGVLIDLPPQDTPAPPAPTAKAPAKRAPAKKTTAKKAPAKKSATARGHSKTPEMTVDEINAAKAAGKL
ncbi:hypothetical protein ACWGDX_32605 [Streptomyces sp. NPDC055025]